MQGESESWWVWCLEAEAMDKLEDKKAMNSKKFTYRQPQKICLAPKVEDYVNTKAEASSKLKGIPGSQWHGLGNRPTVLHGRISRGRRRPKASVDKDLENTAFKFEMRTNILKQEPACHVHEKKPYLLTKYTKKERKDATDKKNKRMKVYCHADRPERKSSNKLSTEYTKQKFPSKHSSSHKKVFL